MELDRIDASILLALVQDARVPFNQLAKRLGVSPGTVNLRYNKLRKSGVIKGSTINLNYATLGIQVRAFIGIILNKASDYPKVVNILRSFPEVTEAHYATGSYNILSRIAVADVPELHGFLVGKLQTIKEIQSTETIIILDTPIKREVEIKPHV
jgi:Lrp/AsnC family transcriptional regulator, regulator for asnA, asnC and gidA